MGEVPKTIKQWQMVQPTVFNRETKETTPGKLEIAEVPVPELKAGEVLVEIAGCGVCHTWYFYDGVRRQQTPAGPGHEIAGTVIAGDRHGSGKNLSSGVMPCRQCDVQDGRGNRCLFRRCPATDRYGAV